ncbi:MAG: DUF6680 family protein [Daejeonella sp.]
MKDTIHVAQQSLQDFQNMSSSYSSKDCVFIIIAVVNIIILILSVYVVWKSPYAVKIGRSLNNEQQKDNAKRNLFLTLFSLRGTPLHYDFVAGLNQIDIVFEDIPSVLNAWKDLRNSLNLKGQVNPDQNWTLLRTNLLSAMAVSLGYNKIQQTDMISDYYPEGHEFQLQTDLEFRRDRHEYYKSANVLNKLLLEHYSQNPPLEEGI